MHIETSKREAIEAAKAAADASSLPQTVFRDADSCGWWHTNSLANRLHGAKTKVFATYLPSNYFPPAGWVSSYR